MDNNKIDNLLNELVEKVPTHYEKSHGTWQAGRWNLTNKGYRWVHGSWH